MTFLLLPHGVADTTAAIWIGAIDENPRVKSVRLEYGSDDGDSCVIELDRQRWLPWHSYHRRSDWPRRTNRAGSLRMQDTGVMKPVKGRNIVSLQTCIESLGDFYTLGPNWQACLTVRADRVH